MRPKLAKRLVVVAGLALLSGACGSHESSGTGEATGAPPPTTVVLDAAAASPAPAAAPGGPSTAPAAPTVVAVATGAVTADQELAQTAAEIDALDAELASLATTDQEDPNS